MYKLYDFECAVKSCKHVFEDLVDGGLRMSVCPKCGGPGYQILSAPKFQLNGTDPGFPGAYDKWARDRSKRAAKEARLTNSTGEPHTSVTEL